MRIIRGKKGLTALDYVIDDEFAQKTTVNAAEKEKPARQLSALRANLRRKLFMKRSPSIPKKLQSVKKRRKLLEKKYRVKQATTLRRKKLRFSFAMAAKKSRSVKKSLGVIIRKRRLTIRRAAVKRLIKSKKTTPKKYISDTERIEMLEKEIVLLKKSLDAVWRLGYDNGYEDGYEQGANTK